MAEEENPLSSPPEVSVTDLLPKDLIKYLSAGGALYLIWSLISSESIVNSIKASPNMAAVVIAFIAFAAAYTIAKYVSAVLESKDAARHRQIEGWFAMVLKDLDELKAEVSNVRDEVLREMTAESTRVIEDLEDKISALREEG